MSVVEEEVYERSINRQEITLVLNLLSGHIQKFTSTLQDFQGDKILNPARLPPSRHIKYNKRYKKNLENIFI